MVSFGGELKKMGKIILWVFIVHATSQPGLHHFIWWVLQCTFQYNNGFLAFQNGFEATLHTLLNDS